MDIIAVLSNVVVDLAIIVILLRWYVRHHGSKDIFLSWVAALGFRILAALLTLAINAPRYASIQNILLHIRFMFAVLFLMLIYWGAIRFVSHRALWRSFFPLIFLFGAILFRIGSIVNGVPAQTTTTVGAFTFQVPMYLIIAMIFIFLYGILLGEHLGRKYGALIIGIAFLLGAVILAVRPFLNEDLALFFGLRIVPELLMMYGFLRLHREADEYLQHLANPRRRYLSAKSLNPT